MTDEKAPSGTDPDSRGPSGAASSPLVPDEPGSNPPTDAPVTRENPMATVADVQAVVEQVTELRERVEGRLLEDQQRQRMYDELYRQLEFARKGLVEEYLAPLARELLLVIDRLDVLGAADRPATDGAGDGQELALVREELVEVLVRRGLRPVDATGEAFDPRVHEAVGRRADPECAGRVVEVRRPGYALGDRLIRPAQVVVGYAG